MSTRTLFAPVALRDIPRVLRERRNLRKPPWRPRVKPPRGPFKRPLLTLLGAVLIGTVALALGAAALVPALFRGVAAIAGIDLLIPQDVSLAALEERSVVYAADGSVLAVLHDEVDRRVVRLHEIPEHVQDAVLTAEDQKFWEHRGYDLEGIVRAAVANFRARNVLQGGSTITQQLAKSMVGTDRTIERKLNELTYAVALEHLYRKRELLERYLNQVYLGSGAYGVASAAEEYFHKKASKLTPAEGALLAGVIRSPARLDPRRNPEGAKRRRNAVLREMARLGHLHPAEAQAAATAPLGVLAHRAREVRQPYFVEAVKREFFANPAFGETRADRINLLFSGGLEIHTTLQPELQQAADEIIRDSLPGVPGPTGAIAAVDPRDGRIVALASGIEFTEEQFDLAAQGRRQPGSSFKPFVLAAALENGFPLKMRVAGSGPILLDMPGFQKPWKVDNYGGADYGDLDLRSALVRSVNTAFAQLIMVVGPEEAARVAERLGIDMRAAMGGEAPVPAIALGGFTRGVTPLEMASAYGVFAAAGQRAEPHVIGRVVNRQGQVLWGAKTETETVIAPAIAGAMVDVMQGVVRGGTGTAARLRGWAPAGKTGTTQLNTDAWFVGTTPVLSAAVWMGHPDAQVPMGRVTGGSIPARMWQRFMTRALRGVEPVAFPETPPLSAVLGRGTATVPDVVGLDATEALRTLADEGFVGIVRSVYQPSKAGEVLWQSPRGGRSLRRGSEIAIGVATNVVIKSSASPTPTPSPTPTETPTATPSGTATPTASPQPSPTVSPSPTEPEPSPTATTRRRRRTPSPSPTVEEPQPDPTITAEGADPTPVAEPSPSPSPS